MMSKQYPNGRGESAPGRRRLWWFLLPISFWVCTGVPAQDTPETDIIASGEEIRYVKDVIYINLRTGPSTRDSTIAVIPSGVRMELLERNKAEGTVRVRLLSGKHAGKEGWVLERFLSKEPIARQRLEAALERTAHLEAKTATLEQELNRLRAAKQQAEEELKRLRKQNAALERELDEIKEMSATAVEAHRQRRLLEQRLTETEARLKEAEAASAAAEEKLLIVVIAAAVLALGVGFYIGYTPVRREKRWRKLP